MKQNLPYILMIAAVGLGFTAWYNDASFMAYVGCALLFFGAWDWDNSREQ